jgi:hypothetical protein
VRNDAQRLADVVAAADATVDHLERGGLTDGLVPASRLNSASSGSPEAGGADSNHLS